MRKKVVFLFLFLFSAVFLPVFTAEAAWDPPSVPQSAAVYFINSDTGTVLYQKNADQKMAPYSTTKLMTAILAMEKYKDSLNTVLTVAKSDITVEALGSGPSTMDLKAGQQLTVEQLLNGLLIYSGNDTANVLARSIGGDVKTFVDQMNQKAKQLGCKNTNYVNPHGYPADNMYTTAYDTYLIAKTAMSYEKIAQILATTSFTFNNASFPNTNAMIKPASQYYYKYVKGGKTGSGTNAVCCASYAEKDNMTYFAVVMGGTGNIKATNTCFADSVALYKWAFGSFEVRTLVDKGTPQAEIADLQLAWNKTKLQLVADKPFSALVPKTTDKNAVKIVPHANLPKTLQAPVTKGQKIGTADVMVSNQKIGEINLVSSETVARSKPLYFVYLVEKFFQSIWFKIICVLLALLLVFYLTVSYIYNNRKKLRNKRRKKYKSPK